MESGQIPSVSAELISSYLCQLCRYLLVVMEIQATQHRNGVSTKWIGRSGCFKYGTSVEERFCSVIGRKSWLIKKRFSLNYFRTFCPVYIVLAPFPKEVKYSTYSSRVQCTNEVYGVHIVDSSSTPQILSIEIIHLLLIRAGKEYDKFCWWQLRFFSFKY